MGQGAHCFELWGIVPELILAGVTLVMVPAAGWARGPWRRMPAILAALGLAAALAAAAWSTRWSPAAIFCGTYAVDGFGAVFKTLILTGALITALLLIPYFSGHAQQAHGPVALLFATLGAMGLASSLDLGLIVLFLQMLSVASYLLVGLRRGDRRGNEAMLKVFIYAAVALAVMAYGLTFVYGLTGTLQLHGIGAALGGADRVWVYFALGLVLIGYAFEMTLVPFHFWAPDVYQGAAAPITGFVSVVPKIAGFAGFARFALVALPDGLFGWPAALAVLAAATMLLGNLAALRQTRLKRLLAYSSIAQAGYALMALAVVYRSRGALTAVVFYLAVYLFMNLGAFTAAAAVERAYGTDRLAALCGLGRRAPAASLVLALSLLSLAGIPPLAGFAGKVLLLTAAMEGGLFWLAVFAAVNMVVALYYYAAVLALMYLRDPPPASAGAAFGAFSLAASIPLAGTLILGVAPRWGLDYVQWVTRLAAG